MGEHWRGEWESASRIRQRPAPIYALADSRLLYWRRPHGSLFLADVVASVGVPRPLVAYVGASNNDRTEFYHEIFEPALQAAASCECRMVLTHPVPEGELLEHAHIIVLAGGSVEAGWRAFVRTGFRERILRRFHEGATLIGVSAGALQLGQGGLTDDGSTLLMTFGLLPFYVGAHEEHHGWMSLRRALNIVPGPARGIGIPSGGGLICHADGVKPVCKPAYEIVVDGNHCREAVITGDP